MINEVLQCGEYTLCELFAGVSSVEDIGLHKSLQWNWMLD